MYMSTVYKHLSVDLYLSSFLSILFLHFLHLNFYRMLIHVIMFFWQSPACQMVFTDATPGSIMATAIPVHRVLRLWDICRTTESCTEHTNARYTLMGEDFRENSCIQLPVASREFSSGKEASCFRLV